jgi:hypothetical protein
VHLLHDADALTSRPRAAIQGGPEVDALLFSTVSPRSCKVFINTEIGDYAHVEQRDRGCELGRIGLRTHLSEIRSFEKLTGEGMTVVRPNLLHILEERLPARLELRVHPSVGAVDETALPATLLAEAGCGNLLDSYMSETWRRAGTVRISREPPLVTAAGKMRPFHPL